MRKLTALSYVWIPLLLTLTQQALAIGHTESGLDANSQSIVIAEQDTGVEKERADVPDELFLSLNGIRYEAIHWGKARGLEQNGGYIAALDEKTGKEKWLVQVYKIHYEHDKEEDKQDVFIRNIALSENKKSLLIENDRGERYRLNLRTRSVKKLIQ